MFKDKQTTAAIVKELPSLRPVKEPSTGKTVMHLAYVAEMQYSKKPPEDRVILCNSYNDARVDDTVLVTYHIGMKSYQHAQNVITSNERNCFGGFYFTDGTPA